MRAPALLTAGLALAALSLTACGDGGNDAESRVSAAPTEQAAANALPTGGSGAVVVGSANFPENRILAEIFEQALDAAGFDASTKDLTTRPVIIPQVTSGAIDVEPDYVGALVEYFNLEKNGPGAAVIANNDLAATLAKAREFGAEVGLTVLDASPAADQNAFAVTKEFAEENDLTTLSDLAKVPGELTLGGTSECQTYTLCKPGLEKTYGKTFSFMQTDLGGPLGVAALKRGTVDVNQYLSSDGSAPSNGFVILEDDKMSAPVDNVIPVVGKEYADNAVLKEVLDKVMAAMTTEDLLGLNASVSIDRKLPADAARDFLVAKGFITA